MWTHNVPDMLQHSHIKFRPACPNKKKTTRIEKEQTFFSGRGRNGRGITISQLDKSLALPIFSWLKWMKNMLKKECFIVAERVVEKNLAFHKHVFFI